MLQTFSLIEKNDFLFFFLSIYITIFHITMQFNTLLSYDPVMVNIFQYILGTSESSLLTLYECSNTKLYSNLYRVSKTFLELLNTYTCQKYIPFLSTITLKNIQQLPKTHHMLQNTTHFICKIPILIDSTYYNMQYLQCSYSMSNRDFQSLSIFQWMNHITHISFSNSLFQTIYIPSTVHTVHFHYDHDLFTKKTLPINVKTIIFSETWNTHNDLLQIVYKNVYPQFHCIFDIMYEQLL
jgi:hypothetical protein